MNQKQRDRVQHIRANLLRKGKHIRSEGIFMSNWGQSVLYEVELGSSNPLGQIGVLYMIGPKGGLKEEKRIY